MIASDKLTAAVPAAKICGTCCGHVNFHRVVAMGIAESSTVVIMGCAFLALAWFIAAIGLRKE